MNRRGLLIAFEGGDGSGKTTQAALAADRLGAVLTRQAGGTPLGVKIRELTLDPTTAHVSQRAEALLYMADRAEHVDELIEPTLQSGRTVVTDRYAYSTMAYQGYGKGLDVEELHRISEWAVRGIWPDLVILIEVPLEVGTDRLVGRGQEADHYEASGTEFQQRVIDGYRAFADADPRRWRVIDGRGSIEEVGDRVWSVLMPLLDASE